MSRAQSSNPYSLLTDTDYTGYNSSVENYPNNNNNNNNNNNTSANVNSAGYDAVQRVLSSSALGDTSAVQQELPQSPISTPLPPGWLSYRDEATGNPYFLNVYTGSTQWEQPTTAAQATPTPNGEHTALSFAGPAPSSDGLIEAFQFMHDILQPLTIGPYSTDIERPIDLYGPSGLISQSLPPTRINPRALQTIPLIQEDNQQFEKPRGCCYMFLKTQSIFSLIGLIYTLGMACFIYTMAAGDSETFFVPMLFLMAAPHVFLVATSHFAYQSVYNATEFSTVQLVAALNAIRGKYIGLGLTRFFMNRPATSIFKSVDQAVADFHTLQNKTPSLRLQVTCWHYLNNSLHFDAKNVARQVTFETSYSFPILGWRDISQNLEQNLQSASPRTSFSTATQNVFCVDPVQRLVLSQARSRAWTLHKHRDTFCSLSIHYEIDGIHNPHLVQYDLIRNNTLSVSDIFFHPYALIFFNLSGLYCIPAAIFCAKYRYILLNNVKMCHVNLPEELVNIPPSQ